jgi:hypothetical protein
MGTAPIMARSLDLGFMTLPFKGKRTGGLSRRHLQSQGVPP